MNRCLQLLAGAVLLGAAWCAGGAEIVLKDDFSTNAPGSEIPAGWRLYRQGPTFGKMTVTKNGLYMKDVCDKSEIGITRILPAVNGKYYRLTATADPAKGTTFDRNSVILQLRFLSDPHRIINTRMLPGKQMTATGQANADKLQIYLFTMKPGQPEITVPEIRLEVSDTPFN